jgi:nicotinamide riboside kinase
MPDPVRIALIGPESSGKSSIAKRLSVHFGFSLVDEYARAYLTKINRPYTLNDILLIYRHQMVCEQQLCKKHPNGIIADTECINGKVWCEEVFNMTPDWFTQMVRDFPYDHYLLTAPDIPWVADPLRENAGRGNYFFERYKKELEFFKLNFSIIDGVGEQRFQAAIGAVEKFLRS